MSAPAFKIVDSPLSSPSGSSQFSVVDPPAEKPTSQELGFEEGALHVFDRASNALKYGVEHGVDSVFPGISYGIEKAGEGFGLPSVEEANAKQQQYLGKREEKETPGKIGEFAGEVVASAPLSLGGPLMSGGIAGYLSGNSTTAVGGIEDTALGSAFGLAGHHLAGYIGSKIGPYFRSAEQAGSDYVARLLKGSNKTAEDVEAYGKKSFGKPVLGGEAVGRVGKSALNALGRREGSTADKLEGALDVRAEERQSRMLDDFKTSLGVDPETAKGNLVALVEQGRKEAAPLYDHAFSVPMSNTPYLRAIENQYNAASRKASDAFKAVHDAERDVTLAQAKLHNAGDNVYGVSLRGEAAREAEQKLETLQKAHADAVRERDAAHAQLRQTQEDVGTGGGGYNARLGQLLQDPLIRRGMAHGIQVEKRLALARGEDFDPHAYSVTHFDADGEPVIGPVPTWKSWDAAKKGIDHVLEESYRNKLTGKLELDYAGRAIEKLRKAMLEAVDDANPAYAAARARAGDYMSARDAFDRGTKGLFSSELDEKQFSDMVGKMAPTDIQALKSGILNRVYNMAQNARIKPAMLQTPRIQAKLTMLFGKDGVEDIVNRFKVEKEMQKSEGRIKPGTQSVTGEVLKLGEEQDVLSDMANDAAHAAVYAASGMPHASGFRLAKMLWKGGQAWFKTPGMPVEVRNEVGRLLMMTPKELADHLRQRPQEIAKYQNIIEQLQHGAAITAGSGAVQVGP